MCTGKGGGNTEHGHGLNVVKYVTNKFMQKDHTVLVCTYILLSVMWHFSRSCWQRTVHTTACGTVIKARKGNHQSHKRTTLKLPKENIAMMTGKTACFSAPYTQQPRWSQKRGRKKDDQGREVAVKCPKVIHKYNCLKSVDCLDQKLNYYTFNQKMIKW